jgi:hypothetical protein
MTPFPQRRNRFLIFSATFPKITYVSKRPEFCKNSAVPSSQPGLLSSFPPDVLSVSSAVMPSLKLIRPAINSLYNKIAGCYEE